MDISKALINLKIWIAYWIWRNLAAGRVPFYASPALRKHQTFTEPSGWRKPVWRRAVDYLVARGELTHTPTLTEKF